jgi:hypothetical protein
MIDIEHKEDNNGSTHTGILYAYEFNRLVDAVRTNRELIRQVVDRVMIQPFDGICEELSEAEEGSVVFSVTHSLFMVYTGGGWTIAGEEYNDGDMPHGDRMYRCENRLYLWETDHLTEMGSGVSERRVLELIKSWAGDFLSKDDLDAVTQALDNKADKSTQITVGNGLTGGGSLDGDINIGLESGVVEVGDYIKVTVDEYGRVVGGSDITEDDLPSIPWSKVGDIPDTLAEHGIKDVKIENGTITIGNEAITPITKTHKLTLKLNGEEIGVYDPTTGESEINIDIKAGGGAQSLSELLDVSLSELQDGNIITYDGENWTNTAIQNVSRYEIEAYGEELFNSET